jgi:glycosyltransferase involved in cell wall biosynthesis
MPVYNGVLYLKEAIESVLNQTFVDFEFIIVNDGSTDDSGIIIEEYAKKDNRIVFIDRKVNKKLAYTLNEGLEAAKGKYIARMDCDDICLPKRFEKQYNFLESHLDISIVGSAYKTFSSVGNGKIVFRPVNSLVLAYKSISDTHFCHPSVMFRREIVLQIGGYDETKAEDFAFFSKIVKHYKGYNFKEVLLHYRQTPESWSYAFKEAISESRENTFEKNYRYYISSGRYCQQFYEFHKGVKFRLFYLPVMIILANKILNQIRKEYHYSKENYSKIEEWIKDLLASSSLAIIRQII